MPIVRQPDAARNGFAMPLGLKVVGGDDSEKKPDYEEVNFHDGCRLQVWTEEEFERIPEKDRPGDAFQIKGVWILWYRPTD